MKTKLLMLYMATSMFWHGAKAQEVIIPSVIKGLTIMLEYKDYPFNDPIQSISDLMNKQGYNANGRLGSVRDYFYTQTNGKVTITSTVVKVSLPENLNYYLSNNIHYVDEAIKLLKLTNPEGFQGLTADPLDGSLLHLNFIVRGAGGGSTNGTIEELYLKNNTTGAIRISQGNIMDIGVGTIPETHSICHEMGHSVMSWTDYYRTAFSNLGDYDLMASAGNSKGGMPINPALRLQRGWITNVINISGTIETTYTLIANSYSSIHKYTNPNNSSEYLLFHVLKNGGYYQTPMDNGKVLPEGLAIWYVDEDGGYSTLNQDPGKQFLIKLIQADNLDEMHDHDIPGLPDIRSDVFDLYGNANKSFPNGHPFRWKDGGEFGISISNISNPGATMSFTVNPRPNTIVATSDVFGTILPKGTLAVSNGQSKSFSFVPNIGYELDVVKVNGVAVTATANAYTVPTVSGHTNTISATFKRKFPIAALPSPWQKIDIGSAVVSGFATASSGTFSIESYAPGFAGSSDNFTYVYQKMNGDGTFIAHIADYNNPTPADRVGIMIRESLEVDAAYSAIVKFPFGGAQVEQRSVASQGLVGDPSNIGALHRFNWNNWLKIIISGDLITSYCSRDGATWNLLGTQTIALPTQLYIGLCLTGSNSTYPSKAVFDNISLTTAQAPLVSITSPLNKTNFTSNSITINATATPVNSSRSITKVDFYSGTTLIGSDNTAPYSLTWNNAIGGNQILVAKATDNTGAIAVSSKINIYVPCSSDPKIGGTVIGTLGSWNNNGFTREKAFDGDISTYFDASEDIAWTGLSLPSSYKVTGISFYPREGATWRMTGGKFQGSNTSDFSSGVVDLATITSEPRLNWNCFSISNPSSFQYLRYISPAGGVGNVAEIEFRVTPSVNIAPTVTITSPISNTSVEAAPTITITATASDPDGTISQVDFYIGSNLVGTDYTAPYTYSWNNAALGSYVLAARAIDNSGADAFSVRPGVTIVAATSIISGPACGSNNSNLSFELSASKRINATGYNWWYNGSVQSITPVVGSPYKASVSTGIYFNAGEICVGVNYSVSPWYISYCKTVTKCVSARMSDEEVGTETMVEALVSPNPTSDQFNLNIVSDIESILIINEIGQTVYQKSNLFAGQKIVLGENFLSGVFMLSIRYTNGTNETKRIVKMK